jgi:DNA-binding GntR family transcriptional regulator
MQLTTPYGCQLLTGRARKLTGVKVAQAALASVSPLGNVIIHVFWTSYRVRSRQSPISLFRTRLLAKARRSSWRLERTVAGRAMVHIQQKIISGELAPGEHLPIEELAQELDISTMPIREALQRLNSAGFVNYEPHRGARVSELSDSEIFDIYALRMTLETLAIKRAARLFSKSDQEAAQHWLVQYLKYEPSDWPAREAQMEFHLVLYRAAGAPWLCRLIEPLFQQSERYRLLALARGSGRDRQRRHEELLRACVDHDEDRAVACLQETLMLTVNTIAKRAVNGAAEKLEKVELAVFMPSRGVESRRRARTRR